MAAARNAAGSAAAGSSGASQPAAGGGGNSDDLSAKYAAAIRAKVLSQWVRPDTVPLGQRCQITITQIPGGTVMQAKVSPNCPYDEAGKRSIEAAVLNAQPLPYRGFESVFARTLNFTLPPGIAEAGRAGGSGHSCPWMSRLPLVCSVSAGQALGFCRTPPRWAE